MLRGLLNSVPITLIMVVAVGLTLGAVLLSVWLIRRVVPATRDGFHAEISSGMIGVVAAVFGLLSAALLLGERPNGAEIVGAVVVLAGLVLTNLPARRRVPRAEQALARA